jgi:hypothetical protein
MEFTGGSRSYHIFITGETMPDSGSAGTVEETKGREGFVPDFGIRIYVTADGLAS